MLPASLHRRVVLLTAPALTCAGLFGIAASTATVAHADTVTTTCSTAYLPLPDPSCTPGVLNPDVTQDTIDSTICVSGWTSTIRPSTSYTNKLKAAGIVDYGYSDTSMSDYEEDHFVPLELGGSPTDPGNPVARAALRRQLRQHLVHQGRGGEQAEEGRVRRRGQSRRRPERDHHQLYDSGLLARPVVTPSLACPVYLPHTGETGQAASQKPFAPHARRLLTLPPWIPPPHLPRRTRR
jgi:hypothetical protein